MDLIRQTAATGSGMGRQGSPLQSPTVEEFYDRINNKARPCSEHQQAYLPTLGLP